jgi:dihydropteroate synthase
MDSAPRPTHWQLRTQALVLPGPALRRPLLMGIVNVTPDSFSDGGRHDEARAAVAHGLALVEQGADILDVGGESTRPYAEPVTEAEELRRIEPVVAELAARAGVPISIDTSKATVARRAIALGAEIINDVTGLEGDPRMPDVAAETAAGICAMHMQGTPRTMQVEPRYADVVAEIHAYLAARRDALVATGIPLDRICLDPGIGFGKTHAHNLELLSRADAFLDLGAPILVGHSRKGFIAKRIEQALGRPATLEERDAGTAGAACRLAEAGVQILRIHAVGVVRATLELFAAAAHAAPR